MNWWTCDFDVNLYCECSQVYIHLFSSTHILVLSNRKSAVSTHNSNMSTHKSTVSTHKSTPWAITRLPWALTILVWALTSPPWALTNPPWALMYQLWAIASSVLLGLLFLSTSNSLLFDLNTLYHLHPPFHGRTLCIPSIFIVAPCFLVPDYYH
jgi:hypothetical protein